MKEKIFITLFFLVFFSSFCSLLNSTTWHIKQDSTGNFTTIQEGIDASSNSDTVLVHPGIYYENLIIIEKNITLGSLYLTTGDESYISQTIIDGFENESVIRIESVETGEVFVCGFTIQNGIGYMMIPNRPDKRKGGGLFINNSNIIISNCFIQTNKADRGGGLYLYEDSYIVLTGNTVRHNRALSAGGGIYMAISSDITYSDEILNNIYLNYAGSASDLFLSHLCPFQEIIVDTFTVMEPGEGYYYIYPASGGAGIPQPGLFSVDIQHAKIEQVNSDLYVSPDGDNNNSGLTPDDPLQSIAYALVKIRSDSLQHKTIHIADGIYSSSLNGQYFPLHLKSHVSIIGESRENTVLDAELYGGHIYAYDPQRDYSIRNLKLIDSRNMNNITIGKNTDVLIDNIRITQHNDNLDNSSYYVFQMHSTDFSLNEVIIDENFAGGGLYLYTMNDYPVLDITNCVFENNTPSISSCKQISIGRGSLSSDSLIVNMINTEIIGNLDETVDWFPSTVAIRVDFECKVNIINSTIGNNETSTGAAVVLCHNSTANIINSILYGTIPREIFLDGRNGANTLNVKNSLVSGGIWDVGQLGYNLINWDESTTLDEDPLWQNSGEFPYTLSTGSPCIDAGTLELPFGVELPEFDLAGNPRIVNGMIDMGAYEFQDTVSVLDNILSSIFNIQLSNYPNPFNSTTTISFDLVNAGEVTLNIYNIKGELFRTLASGNYPAGKHSVIWNGIDNNKKKVSSGVYFYQLITEKITITKKMILLR